MKNMTRNLALWLAGIALAYSVEAIAQERPAGYPARPIRIVVSVAPGGGSDAMSRAVAQMLTDAWGQTIVVDNRPGGGGIIATELVAAATPDGYTIMSQGNTVLLQDAMKRVPFRVLKVFDPIVAMSAQAYILMVNLSLPIKSVKDMIAFSKTQTLNYAGSAGIGSPVHLGIAQLAQLSGGNMTYVAYKGSAPAILAVMSGEIHMAAGSSIAATAAIRTGKVRALATTSLKRLGSMPDLPTVAEQGFPGWEITNRYNLLAPAGTPRGIVAAINRVVADGMHSPQMEKRLAADGSQAAERMTPAQYKATMARDLAQIEKQVKALNIKIQ